MVKIEYHATALTRKVLFPISTHFRHRSLAAVRRIQAKIGCHRKPSFNHELLWAVAISLSWQRVLLSNGGRTLF